MFFSEDGPTQGGPTQGGPMQNPAMLRGVGYQPSARLLEVEFPDRSVWEYADVSEATYAGLFAAKDRAAYLNEHVAPTHKHRKMKTAPPLKG